MPRGLNFTAPESIAPRQLGLGLFTWVSLGAASLAGLASLVFTGRL